MSIQKTPLALLIASCFSTSAAFAQEANLLSPVVVTATRVEQNSFDLPMSIDKVEMENIRDGQPRLNLSESLIRVPGITAQSRTSQSSDPQISSRGFGARSSFGVRGIRLYVDGIPLSMPDGIGNPGNLDLGVVSAIEVMRGPFSAMYGNSSGGVIQLFTAAPPASPEVSGDFYTGSFGTRRQSVETAGVRNGVEYLLSVSDYRSDGYRLHSANEKKAATAKLKVALADDLKMTTIINWFDQFAQDPGGLTSTYAANPTAAAPTAISANTRVYRTNTQVGFNFEKTLNAENSLNLITYAGQRSNQGYLALAGVNGRASIIDRDFYGIELRGTNKGNLLTRPYTLTYGLALGQMQDLRKDINTANGNIPAVNPTVNRNEAQSADNVDQYVQGMWNATDRLDLHAGVRHTQLNLKIRDKLPADASGNGSGSTKYDKTIPVFGAVFKVTPTLNFYANVGKGFETPTLIEITYGAGGTGSNMGIKPSTSTNIEVGSKMMFASNASANLALFDISTVNEIIASENNNGRVSYTNAGKTRRTGAELSVQALLSNSFSLYAAYTLLNAEYDADFTTAPNTANSGTVKAGNQIPGTYRSQIYAEAAWKYQPLGFQTAVEARYNTKVFVNDINSAIAPSYAVVNLRASFTQQAGKWRLTEYARIENLLDEAYVGSVRVNDTNSRYYETAPGRNWILGLKANYAF